MTMKIRPIIMLKTGGSHYSENLVRTKFFIESIQSLCGFPNKFKLTIVCPTAEMDEIKNSLKNYPVQSFVADEVLCPNINSLPASGWKKQQFLKLAFAEADEADFIMTFDPDIFAKYDFTVKDFIEGNRALIEYESRPVHPAWWAASADLLRFSLDIIPERVMTVTPCLYSSEVARLLRRRIERLHGDDWAHCLLSQFKDIEWVEHGLYFMMLVGHDLLDYYHFDKSSSLIHSSENMWFSDEIETLDVDRIFNSPGIFGTIASSSGISFSQFEGDLRRNLAEKMRGSR